MDTLLIPCWARPEFLWHTLDNLSKTGDLHTVHILFKPDTSHHEDIPKVIEEFERHYGKWEIIPPPKGPWRNRLTKQSRNLLEGYRVAAEKSDGLVFMVEEDVQVSRDFFRYHRALHQQQSLFCSLSTRNHNRAVTTTNDPSAYYLSTGDYCSLGVCFPREVIQAHILPHACTEYYADPVKYCRTVFPHSSVGHGFAEQDGLIRRVQEVSGLPTAYPHVPRAFHAGYYGYNRRRAVHGTTEEKTERLRTVIYDPENMRQNSLRPEYYADSIPVPLDIEPWERLEERSLK